MTIEPKSTGEFFLRSIHYIFGSIDVKKGFWEGKCCRISSDNNRWKEKEGKSNLQWKLSLL